MLRSFASLARNRILTESVMELGLTRQTIRRHITQLEDMLGCTLLVSGPGGYELTEEGRTHLRTARRLLLDAGNWILSQHGGEGGLHVLNMKMAKGGYVCIRQKPLSEVRRIGTKVIRSGFEGWLASGGALDHPACKAIMDTVVLFRPEGDDLLCIHVGERSGFAFWYGSTSMTTSIGTAVNSGLIDNQSAPVTSDIYNQVMMQGSARYDHVAARLARPPHGEMIPIRYQRLLLGFHDEIGRPYLAMMSVITDAVDLDPPPPFETGGNSPHLIME